MLFDSHAHLSHTSLRETLPNILHRAEAAGIKAILNICTNPEELEHGLRLAQQFPWIYVAGATTPHDAAEEGEKYFEIFAEAARDGKLTAIGESGLDYHYYRETQEIQKELFRRYLRLAAATELSIVVHCREAFEDLFAIIDEEKKVPGILHCFTGTLSEAKEVIDRGCLLSLSGIVTYKKSHELREVAKWVPIDKLLIETDTPYLAPQTHRGKTNEPAFLIETAKCIADVRGVSEEEIGDKTKRNAEAIFSLK